MSALNACVICFKQLRKKNIRPSAVFRAEAGNTVCVEILVCIAALIWYLNRKTCIMWKFQTTVRANTVNPDVTAHY